MAGKNWAGTTKKRHLNVIVVVLIIIVLMIAAKSCSDKKDSESITETKQGVEEAKQVVQESTEQVQGQMTAASEQWIRIEGKVDALDTRLTSLETDIRNLDGKIPSEERLQKIETRIDTTRADLMSEIANIKTTQNTIQQNQQMIIQTLAQNNTAILQYYDHRSWKFWLNWYTIRLAIVFTLSLSVLGGITLWAWNYHKNKPKIEQLPPYQPHHHQDPGRRYQ